MSDIDAIQITQNDKGYKLNFTVKDVDLTGMTIEFQVAEQVTYTAKFAGACDITTAANGTCSYTVAAGDFDTVNNYYGILQLTNSGVVESTRRFEIEVISKLSA